VSIVLGATEVTFYIDSAVLPSVSREVLRLVLVEPSSI
jgi:hypothetical protein